MSRIAPVFKRELIETVGTKGFLIGTILGPLLILGFFAAQFFIIAKGSGGLHRVAIVDASGAGIGARVEQALENPPPGPRFISMPEFRVDVQQATADARTATAEQLRERVAAKELDGFLWVPPDVTAEGAAEYEGDNAQNSQAMSAIEQALQRTVQSERLRTEGIDESRLAGALTPIRFRAYKTGEQGAGSPVAGTVLAFLMAFAIYIMVIMYGQAIMQAVQEEKRDRIVELIVSSIRARDLLLGKVLGIGTAGVIQLLIWVGTAAFLMTYGAAAAALFSADPAVLEMFSERSIFPSVAPAVGFIFVLYFAGGFFLFATLFAVIGAIVTDAKEAQNFVFPVLMPFILGLFMAMPAAENPNSSMAVAGSIIPFTSPMVMPVRAVSAGVDWVQVGISLALLYATAIAIIWLAAKIYRVAIFATGKKPSFRELVTWTRAA